MVGITRSKVNFWNGKQKGRVPNLGCRNWEKTKKCYAEKIALRWFDLFLFIFVGHVKIMQCHACPSESMWSTCTVSIHFNWFPHAANMRITIDQVIFNDTCSTYTHTIRLVPVDFLMSEPHSWIQLVWKPETRGFQHFIARVFGDGGDLIRRSKTCNDYGLRDVYT